MKGGWVLPALLAAPLALASAPATLEFQQRPGAAVPLELQLKDEGGQPVRLGEVFGRVPVVLVPGYFRCRNLCSTVLDGVLEGLQRSGLGGGAYRVVAFSIDPREGAADARQRRASLHVTADGGALSLLTGDGAATARLAEALGFPYRYDAQNDEFVHPAGFAVVTPAGTVARYFFGVRFDPRALRLALVEASAGRVGSLSDRLLLLCSHYDPSTGRYSTAVMTFVRAGCALCAAGLGLWLWRRRARRAQ